MDDRRIVLTLDAGGSSFRFSATQGGRTIVDAPPRPSHGDNLSKCFDGLMGGFADILKRCPAPPVAISFAFPGPADYPAGIIGDLPNLPAFRGGVALGPVLEKEFGLPVVINNDGNLFAYGEALAGFLPHTNELLEKAGSSKRYRNLLGVTFGTGFGGGIVSGGQLLSGDNSAAGEVWLLRNKLNPSVNAEEGVSIRAVRRVYAECASIPFESSPSPKSIAQIALGAEEGNKLAATESYRRLGEVAGDAIAQVVTLIDGLVVIGGGMAGASELFMPALIEAMNDRYAGASGVLRRLGPEAYNLEDQRQRAEFLRPRSKQAVGLGPGASIGYDYQPRTGVGIARLATSEAIALGAYAQALRRLDS